MRIRCLRHVFFEGGGVLEEWARNRGFSFVHTKLDENEPLPVVESFDLLVILGGPMNVYEEKRYPWLREEKRLIGRGIEAGKKILGICLGAQLIADVLGAKVSANRDREIGWHPVRLCGQAEKSPLVKGIFPEEFAAFHWHGDRFEIPYGALHWAKSSGCEHQAFCYGPNVFGFQFHLESTPESIEKMLYYCPDDLTEGPYVQNAQAIRKGTGHLAAMHRHLFSFLNEWCKSR